MANAPEADHLPLKVTFLSQQYPDEAGITQRSCFSLLKNSHLLRRYGKSAPLRISAYATFADLPCFSNLEAFEQARSLTLSITSRSVAALFCGFFLYFDDTSC